MPPGAAGGVACASVVSGWCGSAKVVCAALAVGPAATTADRAAARSSAFNVIGLSLRLAAASIRKCSRPSADCKHARVVVRLHHRRNTVWRICAGSIARADAVREAGPSLRSAGTCGKRQATAYTSLNELVAAPPEAAAQSKAVAADARARAAVQAVGGACSPLHCCPCSCAWASSSPLQASEDWANVAGRQRGTRTHQEQSAPREILRVRLREGGERQRSPPPSRARRPRASI